MNKPARFLPSVAKFCCIACLGGVLTGHCCVAQTVDSTEEARKFFLEVYGELLYSHYDFGPDQASGENGAPDDSRSITDLPRFETELKYYFEPDIYLEVAVEYEHGGTGGALELEFEEFGEYEQEVEKGGEVLLEELHITKSFGEWLKLRIGHQHVPVGLLNSRYKPTQFFGSVRPESETALMPVTWHETGVSVFGKSGDFAYRLGLVNGLDATGFNSKFWIRDGHQGRFEVTRATDMAVFARLDYTVFAGTTLGASFYRGNTTGNRPKPDMEGIDAHLTIVDAHAIVESGGFEGRALLLYGSLENADLISQSNLRLSRNLGVSRTPVASAALAYSVEAGYNVLPFLFPANDARLIPFARYEFYDSMFEVDESTFDVPRFERTVLTFGINYFLNRHVVLKSDYSMRSFGDSAINGENTFSIAVGFFDTILAL